MEKEHCNAALLVLEQGLLRTFDLSLQTQWLIGRYDPVTQEQAPDIPLSSPIASRVHGWLRRGETQWYFVDNPRNLNGTLLNGKKLRRASGGRRRAVGLECGDVLSIDSTDQSHGDKDGVKLLLFDDTPAGTWNVFSLAKRETLRIRAQDGDLRVPNGQANLLHLNGTWYLSDDTGSTRLNEKLLECALPLNEGDWFWVGESRFCFLGSCLLYMR